MDLTDDDIQERFERCIDWFHNACHILNAYQSHQSGDRQLRMSRCAWQMAMGFNLAAGADGPTDAARNCGVSKQAFGKCLNHFIDQLKLSPLPFQRKEEARENMAAARRAQVCKPKEEAFIEK